MKLFITITAFAAGLLALAETCGAAQTPPALTIDRAIHIDFATEVGKTYTLQGSVNLRDWVDIGNSVLGHGRVESRLFSLRDAGLNSHASYRLRIEGGPTNGLAPDSFAGLTLNLDNQPGGDLMQFTTATTGVDLGVNPDPFSYVLTRLNASQVEINLTGGGYYEGIKRDIYVFTFTAPGRGTWTRDEYRNGALNDRDTGVFSVVSGTTPGMSGNTNQPPAGTNSVPTAPPVSLAGLVYIFQTGTTPDRLEFLTATTGIEYEDNVRPTDDNPNKPFTYTYSFLASNTATLILNLPNNRRDEYDLTFTMGAQGSFVRREFRNGALDDTDRGSFSPSSQPPTVPGGTNNPPATNPPPAQPVGFTYTMLSGVIPERLAFISADNGTQFDDSAPTQFTFTYTSTGASTVSLIVRFKADKWDEYDLTFTSSTGGTFVRREFDRNALKDTDSGPFTISPATP